MNKELMKNPADLTKSIQDVFAKIDTELRLLDADGCGSTACACIVRKEGSNSVLYVANLGDTRAVLSKGGQAERMSVDHKCDNQEEVKRIKGGGGIILDMRVGGVLAVTRAFGDHSLRRSGLSAEPYIVKHTLRQFDKFLVIASDGIWDELSDQDAVNYCNEDMPANKSS
jgi:serine/threonine protein phosphatase PrpC